MILGFSANILFFQDLILYSPASCIVELPGSDGMSTGTFLITLLLMVSSIYFFGGAILLYALRGAQGRELIPHVDFWTSLPELVRVCFSHERFC